MARSRLLRRMLKQMRSAVTSRPLILMYHRIAEEGFDPWGLAVPQSRFREQLAWLSRHRRTLPLEEFIQRHRAGKLPGNAVAITFDDGYACNSTCAAPLLAEHRLPATIFLTTDPIRDGREFWWDELERSVFAIDDDQLSLDLPRTRLEVALGARQADDGDWAPFALPRTARQLAYLRIWEALRKLGPKRQREVLDELRVRAGLGERARETHRPMTRSEVRGLTTHGIDVGAHSLSHTSLPDRTKHQKKREIEGSRDECAALVGAPPRTFAYPYGDFDDESAALVEASGFDCGCTVVGTAVRRRADPYRLPRLQVRNWSSGELARALAAA